MTVLLMSRPKPFSDESPRSYLIRLSEANGYPSSQPVYQLLGEVPQYVVTAGWNYERLKLVLGSGFELPPDFGYRVLGVQARESAQLLGHRLQSRHLGLVRPRICVACVKTLGYIPASWDLKAFIACPEHGMLMLKVCHCCGERIQNRRPGLLTCRCGANLEEAPQEPSPSPLTALCEVLGAIVSRDESRLLLARQVGMPVRDLMKMDLAVLLKVIVGLATAVKAMSEWCGTARPYSELVEAIPDAANALVHWPYKFSDLCKAWQEHPHSFLGDDGFQSRFAWLFTKLHKNLGGLRSQTAFMLEAAAAYGSRRWDNRPFWIRNQDLAKRPIPEPRFGSASAAAKILGVDPITVGRWAAKGKLAAERCGKTGNRPFWLIDLDLVRRHAQENFNRMSFRDGAARLGVSIESMHAFFDAGIFPNRQRIGGRSPCVASEDVDGLVGQLAAVAAAPPSDLQLIPLRMFLRRWHPTKQPEVISRILEGEIKVFGTKALDFRGLLVELPTKKREPKKPGISKPVDGWLTVQETVEVFGLHRYEAHAIFLRVRCASRNRFARVKSSRIEAFLSKNIPARILADRHHIWSLQLIRALRRLRPDSLLSLNCGRGNGTVKAFFVPKQQVSYVNGVARRLAKRHTV